MTDDTRPLESAGLARLTAFTAASLRLGYVSHQYGEDRSHAEVLRAQERFNLTFAALQSWIMAVEKTMDVDLGHDGGLRARAGRVGTGGGISIQDEATDAGSAAQCRNGTNPR